MEERMQWSASFPPHMKASAYATKPTRFTVFLRTFLPWQMIRFVVLNIKIMRMTHRNEHPK